MASSRRVTVASALLLSLWTTRLCAAQVTTDGLNLKANANANTNSTNTNVNFNVNASRLPVDCLGSWAPWSITSPCNDDDEVTLHRTFHIARPAGPNGAACAHDESEVDVSTSLCKSATPRKCVGEWTNWTAVGECTATVSCSLFAVPVAAEHALASSSSALKSDSESPGDRKIDTATQRPGVQVLERRFEVADKDGQIVHGSLKCVPPEVQVETREVACQPQPCDHQQGPNNRGENTDRPDNFVTLPPTAGPTKPIHLVGSIGGKVTSHPNRKPDNPHENGHWDEHEHHGLSLSKDWPVLVDPHPNTLKPESEEFGKQEVGYVVFGVIGVLAVTLLVVAIVMVARRRRINRNARKVQQEQVEEVAIDYFDHAPQHLPGSAQSGTESSGPESDMEAGSKKQYDNPHDDDSIVVI